jgi:curved DNA-binding protein CbpA
LIQIKKAYRTLVLEFHPDRNKSPNATSRFIEVTEAYEVLGDETKRGIYNTYYNQYFVKKRTIVTSEQQSKQNEWAADGENKAKQYTSMSYDDFVNRIKGELKIGYSFLPNFIFIAVIGIAAIGTATKLPESFSDKYGGQFGMFLSLIFIGEVVLLYYLVKTVINEYPKARTENLK